MERAVGGEGAIGAVEGNVPEAYGKDEVGEGGVRGGGGRGGWRVLRDVKMSEGVSDGEEQLCGEGVVGGVKVVGTRGGGD